MTKEASVLIGKRIRIAREQAGINKKELAERINVSPSTISRYESGDFDRVKIAILKSIAEATNVNPLWISGESENMDVPKANTYYLNEETAQMAQELFENKEMRILFSAARDAKPEDLKTAADVLLALKRKEGYNGDDPA